MPQVIIEYDLAEPVGHEHYPDGLRLPVRVQHPSNLTRKQVMALLREDIFADELEPSLPPEERP